jgi:hypothetical protein
MAAAPAANTVVTGVLGFLVVAGMAIVLFFLLRSMNKQLRKVGSGPKWRRQIRDGEPGRPAGQTGVQNEPGGAPPGPPGTP